MVDFLFSGASSINTDSRKQITDSTLATSIHSIPPHPIYVISSCIYQILPFPFNQITYNLQPAETTYSEPEVQ